MEAERFRPTEGMSGYKAGNLGFKWVSCKFGDNVSMDGPVCVLGCVWKAASVGADAYYSTLTHGVLPITFDAGGDWKANQPFTFFSDMIDGFQRQDILKLALALGKDSYGLIMGGYDMEPYWLPSDWQFNKSGGGGGLDDEWWFLIAYRKNGLLR